MDFLKYSKIRSYCWADIGLHIDTPDRETLRLVRCKLEGSRRGDIHHEAIEAKWLVEATGYLTPREHAAAVLLACASNLYLQSNFDLPRTGNNPPLLDVNEAALLAQLTHRALTDYAAAFLPDKEAAVLLADCEATPAPPTAPMMATGTHDGAIENRQLYDMLKKPQELGLIETVLIRHGIEEGPDFETRFGVTVEMAESILFAWEAAQATVWDAAILGQFIDTDMFPDRRIVQLRIDAALPNRFTPATGLEWLKSQNIPIGDLSEWVLRNIPFQHTPNGAMPGQNTATPAPVVAESAQGDEAWKERAREKAGEIIKRQKAIDAYPSQEAIADEIARAFRQDGIVGAGGKPLTGAYIKRHALKGISSELDKQLSTPIRRGK